MINGCNILVNTFTRFGLIVHIGKGTTKSKTEAMYFPPNKTPDANHPRHTRNFNVADGFIHFCPEFKYLGSKIDTSLSDNIDVEARINSAWAAMAMLRPFFRSPSVSRKAKRSVYLAIPVNLLLWGCESWGVTNIISNRLEVFHTKALRIIAGISMRQVKEKKISNKMLLTSFKLPPMKKFLRKRQKNWIERIANMSATRLPRKIVTAWCPTKRKRGKPLKTPRSSLCDALSDFIHGLSTENNGSFKLQDWTPCAQDKNIWDSLFENYLAYDE